MLEVSSNTPYNYSELATITLSNILSLIANRDSYASDVPDQLKANYSRTDTLNRSHGAHEGQVPCTITYTVADDPTLKPVSTAQIADDYYRFLESRGIYTKTDQPVTTKGIINFFNNIAAFCAVRLVLVTSQYTPSEFIFYNPKEVTYPTVSVVDNTVKVTDANIQDMLTNLNTTINNVSKLYTVKYVASSNSSSSSSSSSCSSAYIAYFNLQ